MPKRIGLAVLVTLLAGCGSGPSGTASRNITRSPLPPVRTIAVSPADYVSRASSASLLIIRASELVTSREGRSRLGNIAAAFRADHEGVGRQLSFAGRRLNLLPAATLLPAHQAMLDRLSSSSNPGSAYVAQMKILLPQLSTLHDQYRRLGTSATLRPVAAMAAPVVNRELQSIRRF